MPPRRHALRSPPPGLGARLAFTLGLAATTACQGDRGEVELNWTLIDRAGGQVFPSGAIDGTCSFHGLLPAAGDERVDYSVRVEVRLCEPGCEAGCGDPACIHTRVAFDCSAARGYATVDARDDPYIFDIRLVATPDDGACTCDIQSPCALIPGPRHRTVEPGLITDLGVYLMVLGVDDIDDSQDGDGRTLLDLAPGDLAPETPACCVPDPTCAP